MGKRVGITGNIGAGKSTICTIFEILGIPIYSADDRAKWLMKNNPKLVHEIKTLLGSKAYLEDGNLNRLYIAEIVFNDKTKLKALNQLVHPAVGLDGITWHEEHNEADYTLNEAALMYESGSYKALDYMILVKAPVELRIKRVMQRDGSTEEQVQQRINNQVPESEKEKVADFIITNDGKEPLIDQVLKIHHAILNSEKNIK